MLAVEVVCAEEEGAGGPAHEVAGGSIFGGGVLPAGQRGSGNISGSGDGGSWRAASIAGCRPAPVPCRSGPSSSRKCTGWRSGPADCRSGRGCRRAALPPFQKNLATSSNERRCGRSGSAALYPRAITAMTSSFSGIPNKPRSASESRPPMISVSNPMALAFRMR